MPPLMYTAKGSYSISKQNSARSGNAANVAKITGIDPATVPSSPSPSSNRRSSFSKKNRRSPSPKFEKRPRRNSKTVIEKVNNKKVTTHKNENNSPTKQNKKRTPLKIKEGKISPPPAFSKPQSRQNGSMSKPQNSIKLPQRRVNSANDIKTTPLAVKKVSKSTVTTTVAMLPSSSPSPTSDASSLDRVSRAMQSLSMGKLYTVDGGFIFPPHHTKDLHLPELAQTSKSVDFEISVSVSAHQPPSSPKRPSIDLGSPRRSVQETSSIPHQTPPPSASRKRRHYAWQMANGSIQNALQSTPSISQLWDSPSRGQFDSMTMDSNTTR